MSIVKLVVWSRVNADSWTYNRRQAYTEQVIFEISKLPNFSEPRFKPFGEGLEDRKSVIARHQTEMLMKLHDLGPGHAISLRYRKNGNRLSLYVIIRLASPQQIDNREVDLLANRVQQMFPSEYHPVRILQNRDQQKWAHATDFSWA